jgi:hypothetical protein
MEIKAYLEELMDLKRSCKSNSGLLREGLTRSRAISYHQLKKCRAGTMIETDAGFSIGVDQLIE